MENGTAVADIRNVREAGTDAIVAALCDGLTVQDRDFRILYQSPSVQQLVGEHVGEYCYQAYEQREGICAGCPVMACFADGEVHTAERSLAIDGKKRVFENIASPIKDEAGTVVAAVEVVRDITPRKAQEERLIRFSNLYHALSHTNKAIIHCHDAHSLFQEICRVAVEDGKFCLAWIGVPDAATGLLRSVACSGRAEKYLESLVVSVDIEREEGRGPTGIAIREGMPYICNDFITDPATSPWRKAALENGIRASAAFPLKREGRSTGALKVYSEQKGFFDEDMVSLLMEMADNISFALDNFAREQQRRKAEEALRESEERLKLVLEGSNDGFWDWDISTDTVNFSCRYLDILGYLPGEIEATATAIHQLIHHDDLPRVEKAFSDHLSGLTPGYEVEYRMLAKNARWRWVLDRGKVVTRGEDGRALRVAGMSSCIDERKLYEDNLCYLSTHDPLTGLFNRSYFDAELARMTSSRQCPISVVIADVDGLKLINDSFGHAEGDRVIKLAAQVLRDTFRGEDVVARIGGDEFGILLPNMDAHAVKEAVKRVRKRQASINMRQQDYTLSISIGSATAATSGQLLETLKLADARMYYYKPRRKL